MENQQKKGLIVNHKVRLAGFKDLPIKNIYAHVLPWKDKSLTHLIGVKAVFWILLHPSELNLVLATQSMDSIPVEHMNLYTHTLDTSSICQLHKCGWN